MQASAICRAETTFDARRSIAHDLRIQSIDGGNVIRVDDDVVDLILINLEAIQADRNFQPAAVNVKLHRVLGRKMKDRAGWPTGGSLTATLGNWSWIVFCSSVAVKRWP